MTIPYAGKSILLSLLIFFAFPFDYAILAVTDPVTADPIVHNSTDVNDLSISDKNQAQIEKLEEIVKNLTELVSRLEKRFSNEKQIKSGDQGIETVIKEKGDLGIEVRCESGDELAAVTKYDPSWSENFHFVSAVKINSDATSVNVLPFKDYEGLSKYFAVGDSKGRVFVFLKNGDVAVEFSTVTDSPITAMLSYLSAHKNDSVLVTGHANGMVLVHRVWENSSGDDWTFVHMENFKIRSNLDIEENGSSVNVLEVHHVGRIRYILSTDASGRLRVFKENGELYGSVMPSSKVVTFLKQRLLFLTQTGAGSLDLRTMRIKESECEGLNNTYIETYVFDATERSKAYGFASDGDLVQVLLLGDVTNFKCRVRSKRKFGIDKPVSVQAIKGYLLIVNREKVFVYNVSSQHYVRAVIPKLAFSARVDDIRSSFIKDSGIKGSVIPLLTSDKERLVVLGLGGGYVGMYRSNLNIFKGEYKTMFWSSPILIFVLFLFGAWQFFAKKKEALTSWGPEEVTQLESSSRSGEAMEMRGGALRGQPRRYASPSRYSGSSPGSFRPPAQDTNPRPPVGDQSFRGSSELKFRGSNIESVGFPKRRENVFVNSQVVDDST